MSLASTHRYSAAFSVEPSQSPRGILTPSEVIPRATTQVRPFKSMPPEHEHGQAHIVEATGHQLCQGLAGALDKGAQRSPTCSRRGPRPRRRHRWAPYSPGAPA